MSASISTLTYGGVTVNDAGALQRIQTCIETFTPFTVTNATMGGDTLPNKVKEMVVEYTFQGRRVVRKVMENQSVNFGVSITDMKYGMEDKFLGLSDYYDSKPQYVQSLYNVIDSKAKLSVTNGNMLVNAGSDDPTPGKVKRLVVDYVYALKPGRGYPQSGTEGQDFKRGTVTVQEGRDLSSSDFSVSPAGDSAGAPPGEAVNSGSGSIKVLIDQKYVQELNQRDTRLCFAFGIANEFDVVAFATRLAARVKLSWENSYKIAASKSDFNHGVMFDVSTTPQDINFGQSYRLPESWTDEAPRNGKRSSPNGFIFEAETMGSAVLYKKVDGQHVPIYFSAHGPLPPGAKETIIPKPVMKVWFGRYMESGTMVSNFDNPAITVDVSKAETTITFDEDGKWKLS